MGLPVNPLGETGAAVSVEQFRWPAVVHLRTSNTLLPVLLRRSGGMPAWGKNFPFNPPSFVKRAAAALAGLKI